ncbi:heavy-metal-associated domain-containing protein [Natronorarus salvus]|uniref:heavy-metal-associated domain-containing protein n=1 Tax=Natronorarus salvus TaxID=3117733 RepID=UPI002F25FF45
MRTVRIMAVGNASFVIQGIESEDDVNAIKETLEEVDGILGTEIDQESGEANINYDVDLLAEERIMISIRELGYETSNTE